MSAEPNETAEADSAEGAEGDAPKRGAKLKRALLWALRIGGTAIGFGYVASIVDFEDLKGAILEVSPWAFVGAVALTGSSLLIAAVRWRLLLGAYGAPNRPSLLLLTRVYWVGFFYNNFLPGGIGGDVVRGVVTRESFGERGTTASMTVVLVERALGLSGLLILVSVTTLVRPLPGTEAVIPYSAALLAAAAVAVGGLAMGQRIAPYLFGPFKRVAASLPTIERPLPFLGALLLSLGTQATVAVTGWVLLDSVSGGAVRLADAFVLVPLAMATAFFPLSVGGAGARETAFVALCSATLGMERADALAVSLLIWFAQLAFAAPGGVLQLVLPVGGEARAS